MLQRTLLCRLSQHSSLISRHARVGVFPIHLDPPTVEHRLLFRILLGQQLYNYPKDKKLVWRSTRRGGGASFSSPENVEEFEVSHEDTQLHRSFFARAGDAERALSPAEVRGDLFYMDQFAANVAEFSRLAPFDELILVPNTKYSVPLRQSTSLAALAVVGTRGIPHLHVDFTALEHPDDTMPIVFQLVERYPNSAVIHWLHDAYEMQWWRSFDWMKLDVPLLLLKTQSIESYDAAKEREKARGVRRSRAKDSQWWFTPPSDAADELERVEVSKWYRGSLESSWLSEPKRTPAPRTQAASRATSRLSSLGELATAPPPGEPMLEPRAAGDGTSATKNAGDSFASALVNARTESATSSSREDFKALSVQKLMEELYPSELRSPTRTHASARRRGDVGPLKKGGEGPSVVVDAAAPGGRGAAATPEAVASEYFPVVELFSLPRHSGAEVRHMLWDQVGDEARFLLTKTVWNFISVHGLYHNERRWAAAVATAAALSSAANAAATPAKYRPMMPPGTVLDGSEGSADGVPLSSSFLDLQGRSAGGEERSGSGGEDVGSSSSHREALSASSMPPLPTRLPRPTRNPRARTHGLLHIPGLVPRLELHFDERNLLARECYEQLKVFTCPPGEEPDLIVPIGGDGYMMKTIRQYWRRFIPFYGINAGHVGHLLNSPSHLQELFGYPLNLHSAIMLYCRCEAPPPPQSPPGTPPFITSELAFNDAWLERSSGQTAQIRIYVNGEKRIHKLKGDGVLVSTAAGSTAYSRALGASPVPIGAPLLQIVGSNVVSPAQWRPAHLEQEDEVELVVLDQKKRPCRGFVDAVEVGEVSRMVVRCSRVAGVTLAYSKSCDLQSKLYDLQFPTRLEEDEFPNGPRSGVDMGMTYGEPSNGVYPHE